METVMTWADFKLAHPDFVWYCTLVVFAAIIAFGIWAYRYEHQPLTCENQEAERRQRNQTVAMMIIILGVIPAVVVWITWVVWQDTLFYYLHQFLGG